MDISDIKLVNRLKADLDKREEDEKERRAELFPELVEALKYAVQHFKNDCTDHTIFGISCDECGIWLDKAVSILKRTEE